MSSRPDVVLFYPAKVNAPSTSADPHHHAEGFVHVIVNGTPVIQNSALTEARPGRIVRKQR